MTALLARHGLWAVFVLMAIDAVFPSGSELVDGLRGAPSPRVRSHKLDVFGSRTSGTGAFVALPFPERSAISPERSAAGRSASTAVARSRAARPHASTWARAARERRALVRPLARLGRPRRPAHPRRPLLHLDPGRGLQGAPAARYGSLTALGSAIWCFALAGVGWGLGASYHRFHSDFSYVEYAVVAGIVAFAAYWVVRRRRSTTMS